MKTAILWCLLVVGQSLALPSFQNVPFRRVSVDPLIDLPSDLIPRIVNGKEAEANSIPYQAYLVVTLSDGTRWACGGSLIGPKYVLTAAHCLVDGVQARVVLGAHNIQQSEASQVEVISTNLIAHSGYEATTIANDIGIVVLDEEVELSDAINIIQLPRGDDDGPTGSPPTGSPPSDQPSPPSDWTPPSDDPDGPPTGSPPTGDPDGPPTGSPPTGDPDGPPTGSPPTGEPGPQLFAEDYAGASANVSGWGRTTGDGETSSVLIVAETTVITNQACSQVYSIVTDSQLCTSGDEGVSTCDGDSGGPLVSDGTLIGIVSYGASGCLAGYPSGYTRVTSFLDWIEENTGGEPGPGPGPGPQV